jgi:hypothetical protein
MAEATSGISLDQRFDEFKKEVCDAVKSHRKLAWWHRRRYQTLKLIPVILGFLSLFMGIFTEVSSIVAGAIGATSGVAGAIVAKLQCVKAANWEARMATRCEGLRLKLLYEISNQPSMQEIASLAAEWREINAQGTAEWEAVSEGGDKDDE